MNAAGRWTAKNVDETQQISALPACSILKNGHSVAKIQSLDSLSFF